MTLPIFPAQALDSSVITTVWIGLCVITFFNLRFGTTVAGLVVPGYLVPLLLVKPAAAFVVWGEGIVTYLVARVLADQLMRRTGNCTMFGRDRFFALLLVSVLVRTVFDGWLLPATGAWLGQHGVVFDYHNNLYSFGLVIIALTANQMWNSGIARGMGVFSLYVGVTYAIVRYVLIPYTNFDIAGLGFLYEGLATDILASPKAYLILLTTAFIASRMNLIYGWEFSGILIPALLALQWFQPSKLLISLVEAGIIFVLGRQALRLPVFRRMNMEGSRLLLLFFTCGYFYKLLLGFVLDRVAPDVKASDFFAFGYLLSTLLAVKMHQKQISWQISRTTVQTSLMGLAAASVIGYGLALLLPAKATVPAAATRLAAAAASTDAAERTLAATLVDRKRGFYASEGAAVALAYTEPQLDAFSSGVRALLRYRDAPRAELLDTAGDALARGGFRIERWGTWVIVRDEDARRGSGLYALNLAPRTSLAVEVPMPLDEPGVFEAAAQLVEAEGHAAFASAGTRRGLLSDERANALRNPRLPFALFHALAARDGVLQVRGQSTPTGQDPPAQLWVQRTLPPGIDLTRLSGRVGRLDTRFGRRDTANPLRDATDAPLAELLLGRPARLRLIARTLAPSPVLHLGQYQRVDGYLYAWLVQRRDAIASAGSGRYRPPALGDLLYLQAEVVDPLQQVAAQWAAHRDEEALEAINAAASTVGYALVLHRHLTTGEEHVVLTEREGGARHWGTYVFRMGAATPNVVEIPRPLAERQTFEYGTRLFTRLKARALLIAGAHPAVRADGRGDVLLDGNPLTLFNLVHQRLVPTLGDAAWVLQVRGRRDTGDAPAPAIVAAFVGKPAATAERPRLDALLTALHAEADTVALAGSDEVARLSDGGADAQSEFVRRLPAARFVSVSVSSQARIGARDTLQDDSDRVRYDALGIPTETVDLRERLRTLAFGDAPAPASMHAVDAYVRTRNVAALADVLASGVAMKRLVDLDTGRDVLELHDASGRVTALRALRRASADGVARYARDVAARDAWLQQGGAWLVGGAP